MAVTVLRHSPSLPRLFARAALSSGGRGGELPHRALRLLDVPVDRSNLLAYQRSCHLTGGDVLPHAYPHLLGFPLQVQLMADRSFPLPLPGLVHLENQVTVYRRLTADDRLDIRVQAADLRPHPKGATVDLLTDVEVAGERVWQGRSTYLRRGVRTPQAPPRPTGPELPDGPAAAVFRVPAGQGRAYARVSHDVNPIHLHPLTARALGFPRAIAHGMWSYARTLAILADATAGPSASHVWFARPVLLPSTVELVAGGRLDQPEGVVLGLRSAKDATVRHLTLRVTSR